MGRRKGGTVKAKQLVCNDCGCRFEIKEGKEPAREKGRPARSAKDSRTQADLSCPECRSYNITTA